MRVFNGKRINFESRSHEPDQVLTWRAFLLSRSTTKDWSRRN